MTAPPPATKQSTLADRIARAVYDPGSIVGRKLGPSWGRGNAGYAATEETVPEWAARAVVALLADTLADAEAYRNLADQIGTLASDGWDDDAAEPDILARFVAHLAAFHPDCPGRHCDQAPALAALEATR